ncbi:hypothetical protein HETIRDRAFT_454717 [Heterobasidion irregulare TC 32-1]|uniref:Uncharacterized protein n=1 Tax=Heterobasidion irregulare (strain TC 32-1) TaxID=747525 RepID=W4JWF5_HETIT|nr:uncharacterized protein HETIRDRAFT_454717 [Heterobasidion irregulare TC 32-1]ETW77420.1 hypothetical protein HETIRDRAFT_454717 [Heterobasidion irregulare TC 32-1]
MNRNEGQGVFRKPRGSLPLLVASIPRTPVALPALTPQIRAWPSKQRPNNLHPHPPHVLHPHSHPCPRIPVARKKPDLRRPLRNDAVLLLLLIFAPSLDAGVCRLRSYYHERTPAHACDVLEPELKPKSERVASSLMRVQPEL